MAFNYTDPDDFITHLKNGNESAYVYLINTYHKMLLIYAISLTNDRDMAQDIVQDVFFDLWKGRKKLVPMRSFKNYIYKITYHKFINQYHKNRAMSSLERAYAEALNQTFDDSNAELLERKIAIVAQGIDDLPKKCKETFLLSKKEGLTNTEIAEYMNVSIKTVEGHLTTAFSLLRKKIGSKVNHVLFIAFGIRRRNLTRQWKT